MEKAYRWQADRRHLIHHGLSRRWFLAGVAVNLILIAVMWFYSVGTSVTISANLPDANISIGNMNKAGVKSAEFRKIPYGEHRVLVERQYYEQYSEVLDVGIFGGHSVEANLEQIPVKLHIRTKPGAEIFIDNQSIGIVPVDGNFEKSDKILGPHIIKIRLDGYHLWEQRAELAPPRYYVSAYLQMTPQKEQELEAQRQQFWNWMAQAQRMYNSRQYREAISAVEQALAINPESQEAHQLRDRVQQTIQILGAQ